MDEIERAKHVLGDERRAVLEGLAAQRRIAEEAAKAQQEWRSAVQALLERGRAIDVSVAEMAEALGVSRQWTHHLTKRQADRAYQAASERALRMGPIPPREPA